MSFLDKRYLLSGNSSEKIFEAVQGLPIIDAHNHCDVKALAEDRNFSDIWECEASTDHYVWECFRKCGVPEEYLTGKNHTNREKWLKTAEFFPLLAGNPTYEWIHLDLKRRLGINQLICKENAKEIWEKSCKVLKTKKKSQQNLILEMNVEAMCSTDDPLDTLEYHAQLQKSPLAGRVRPTFRPDKAMNINKPGWADYIKALGKRWKTQITSIDRLVAVLQKAHDFFAENGCRASDHGVNTPYCYLVSKQEANRIFCKALKGEPITNEEFVVYHSYFMHQVAKMDAEKGFVFQLHIGAVRDVRDSLYKSLGLDCGGDVCDHKTDFVQPLLPLLNQFDGKLKVVLYNMNPIHNATLAQLTRAFGHTVSLGLAWWLNDSYIGMKTQLEYCSSVDLLTNMAGMVSDSRKILSYGSRFEVFRRTLSNVLGGMVDRGQVALPVAKNVAMMLCYERPKSLFGF